MQYLPEATVLPDDTVPSRRYSTLPTLQYTALTSLPSTMPSSSDIVSHHSRRLTPSTSPHPSLHPASSSPSNPNALLPPNQLPHPLSVLVRTTIPSSRAPQAHHRPVSAPPQISLSPSIRPHTHCYTARGPGHAGAVPGRVAPPARCVRCVHVWAYVAPSHQRVAPARFPSE